MRNFIYKLLRGCDTTGSSSVSVNRASTIIFPDHEGLESAKKGENFNTGFCLPCSDASYGRSYNTTNSSLARLISALEHDADDCDTLLFPSGLSAITISLMSLCSPGSHILVSDSIYKCTRRFIILQLFEMGVSATFFKKEDDLSSLIQSNTSVIYIESPGSVTFEILDIQKIVEFAKSNSLISVCDNTWSSPMFFQPLKHGIDLSLCSLTKHVNGHSDVMMGSATARGDLKQKLRYFHQCVGIAVSPDDSFLVSRGIATLECRFHLHSKSCIEFIKWLKNSSLVEKVFHSGANSHLWNKYFGIENGLVSVQMSPKYSYDDLRFMVSNMKVFNVGVSWGGFNSLVHIYSSQKIFDSRSYEYDYSGVPIMRFFCGLIDVNEMTEDFIQSYAKMADRFESKSVRSLA